MYNDEYDMLFCHVPKTGGTVINAIFNASFSTGFTEAENKCAIGLTKHSTIIEYQQILSEKKFKSTYKITSIRNPYDRFISYYLNHIVFKNKNLLKIDSLDERLSRETFNKWVCKDYLNIVESKERQSPGMLKKINSNIFHHYAVNNEGLIDFNFILDFDNLNRDMYAMLCNYCKRRSEMSGSFDSHKLFYKIIQISQVDINNNNSSDSPKYREYPLIDIENRSFNISKYFLKMLESSKSSSSSNIDKAKILALKQQRNKKTTYFDSDSLEIFEKYNKHDIRLYEEFKTFKCLQMNDDIKFFDDFKVIQHEDKYELRRSTRGLK